jgi:hypothetical protein
MNPELEKKKKKRELKNRKQSKTNYQNLCTQPN